MKTLVLGAISALTLSVSATAEPLTGADMSLALGGKMLAGDDSKFYRFYANGLLEVTGEDDAELAMSFGKWEAGPKYLCLSFPSSEERSFYTLDAQGAALDELGNEGFEGALSIVMQPIEDGPVVSGTLDMPQTIRLQRLLEEGSEAAALRPLPDIVNEIKPVLLAADALRLLEGNNALPTDGAEGAE